MCKHIVPPEDVEGYIEYDYTTKEYEKLLKELKQLKELPCVEIVGLDRIKDRGNLIYLFHAFKNNFILQNNTYMIEYYIKNNMYNINRAYLMYRLMILAQWTHEKASLNI